MNPTMGASGGPAGRDELEGGVRRGWSWPDNPVKGSWPTMRTLEAMVETASRTSVMSANPVAMSVLAQNMLERLVDRVSTVFHVPCWSSLAKMSPATIAVSRGSTHWEAKPRTSSAIA